jgi:hypothetical protein
MDLEDLIKGKRHQNHGHDSHERYDDDHDRHGHKDHLRYEPWGGHHNKHSHHNYSIERFLPYLKQLTGNKKILGLIISLGFICLIIAIAGIIILVPLLMHAFDYIDKNGVKGLFDLSQTIIDRVINGSGK